MSKSNKGKYRSRLDIHIKQHFFNYYCKCGFGCTSRDIASSHKNWDSELGSICLNERSIFEVDLEGLSRFIEKISLLKVVKFTQYTGPAAGRSFNIAMKPTDDQYEHEHVMSMLPKVTVSGGGDDDKVGTKKIVSVRLKRCDTMTTDNLPSTSSCVVTTTTPIADEVCESELLLDRGRLLSPIHIAPSSSPTHIDNTEECVGIERVEDEECQGNRSAVVGDDVECQAGLDVNVTSVGGSCARLSYALILENYRDKLTAMRVELRDTQKQLTHSENETVDLRDKNKNLTRRLDNMTILLRQHDDATTLTTSSVREVISHTTTSNTLSRSPTHSPESSCNSDSDDSDVSSSSSSQSSTEDSDDDDTADWIIIPPLSPTTVINRSSYPTATQSLHITEPVISNDTTTTTTTKSLHISIPITYTDRLLLTPSRTDIGEYNTTKLTRQFSCNTIPVRPDHNETRPRAIRPIYTDISD